jgi:hypothetical protein
MPMLTKEDETAPAIRDTVRRFTGRIRPLARINTRRRYVAIC